MADMSRYGMGPEQVFVLTGAPAAAPYNPLAAAPYNPLARRRPLSAPAAFDDEGVPAAGISGGGGGGDALGTALAVGLPALGVGNFGSEFLTGQSLTSHARTALGLGKEAASATASAGGSGGGTYAGLGSAGMGLSGPATLASQGVPAGMTAIPGVNGGAALSAGAPLSGLSGGGAAAAAAAPTFGQWAATAAPPLAAVLALGMAGRASNKEGPAAYNYRWKVQPDGRLVPEYGADNGPLAGNVFGNIDRHTEALRQALQATGATTSNLQGTIGSVAGSGAMWRGPDRISGNTEFGARTPDEALMGYVGANLRAGNIKAPDADAFMRALSQQLATIETRSPDLSNVTADQYIAMNYGAPQEQQQARAALNARQAFLDELALTQYGAAGQN